MKTIAELTAPSETRGRLEMIVVRGERRAPAWTVDATNAIAGVGLADDRLGTQGPHKVSSRQVTLIQHEHLPVIAQLARVERVDPVALRRNLVISGINLLGLKTANLQIGDVVLELVDPCHPCSRMEEAIGPGGYAAMRGHGGMTARILTGGALRVGDTVRALPRS